MGRQTFAMVTKHRWLWPLVNAATAVAWMIRDAVMKREARRVSRR